MTDSHRSAYNKLLQIIQSAGYTIASEKFQSDIDDPDFKAQFWLIPPEEEREAEDVDADVDTDVFEIDPSIDTESGPPWYVMYHAWEKTKEAYDERGGPYRPEHTGERVTFDGIFFDQTPLSCINSITYELRGSKSPYELAGIDEIRPAAEVGKPARCSVCGGVGTIETETEKSGTITVDCSMCDGTGTYDPTDDGDDDDSGDEP